MYSDNIQHLQSYEVDKAAWDDCIDHAPNGLVYALSWYLDVVSPSWEAIVVEKDARYLVCFPLPIMKIGKIKYIAHPVFCQQLGIYYRDHQYEKYTKQILKILLTAFRYIPRLCFNTSNTWQVPSHPRLHAKTYYTHLLSLDNSYEKIRSGYHRDRRYRVNQAKKKNISIESSDDINPLISIFVRDTEEKIPSIGHDTNYSLLRSLFEAVKANGRYELYYTLDDQGNHTSGCWFVIYNYRIIYLFNAALNGARHENGRSLIIDHVIQKYQSSLYVLDFESPGIEAIDNFYSSFGSRPTPFYFFYYNNLPVVVRKLHRIKIQIHRKILQLAYPRRKMPDIVLPS